MTPTVHVDHLTRRYRGQLALDDASCVLQPDTITGLLGRNGAGKSTSMKILTGQEFPTSGRFWWPARTRWRTTRYCAAWCS
jgi:ABC-2 type transport system ATP-binding protein